MVTVFRARSWRRRRVGWRGRARQARRASITDGVPKWPARKEHDPTEGPDQRRIHGWPAGRACGTDGTQAASEKRPRQRGDFGGSIAIGYFLPWLIRSFSARLSEFSTFRLARIAPSRGFQELPIPISKRFYLKDVISSIRGFLNSILNLNYLTFLDIKAFSLNLKVFASRTHFANDVNLNYNEYICIRKKCWKNEQAKKRKENKTETKQKDWKLFKRANKNIKKH